MKPFKLIPSFSFSEKDFKESISKEHWDDIRQKAHQNSFDCYGCNYSSDNKESLQLHLHWYDGIDKDTAEFVLLCKACHAVKHFDIAVENGWVVLVNSVYSQEELIKRNRSAKTIKKDIEEHKIILLKKHPLDYLNELKESEFNRSEKIKLLFGNKFSWSK